MKYKTSNRKAVKHYHAQNLTLQPPRSLPWAKLTPKRADGKQSVAKSGEMRKDTIRIAET